MKSKVKYLINAQDCRALWESHLLRYDPDIVGRELRERRSIEQACADLRTKYEKRPTPTLARMIEQLQTEIAIRKAR
jgi:hypothetical protein